MLNVYASYVVCAKKTLSYRQNKMGGMIFSEHDQISKIKIQI